MYNALCIWIYDLTNPRLLRLRRLVRTAFFLVTLALLLVTLHLQQSWWWLTGELPLLAAFSAVAFLGFCLDAEHYERRSWQ